MKFYRRRPSPALILSIVAVSASLGGTAYAAATIGSDQIKDNSIKGRDIRDGAVGLADHANNSVRGRTIKPNSLDGSDVNEGALGKVPLASSADSAVNAAHANTADTASNANAVNGRTAASLDTAGNSNQNGALVALPATFTVVAQTSITTSRAGFVLASGSAELSGNGATTGTCLITIDGVNSLAYEVNPDDVGPPVGDNQAVSSVNFGRNLAAGTHTAQLQCRSVDGTVTKDDAGINLVGVGG